MKVKVEVRRVPEGVLLQCEDWFVVLTTDQAVIELATLLLAQVSDEVDEAQA